MGRRKGHKKCDRAVQEYDSSNPSDTTEPDCLINIPQLRAISIRFTFLYRYDCSCGTQHRASRVRIHNFKTINGYTLVIVSTDNFDNQPFDEHSELVSFNWEPRRAETY